MNSSSIRPAILGVVLAGGRSTRMGIDKAQVEFHGETLIQIALRTLRESGLEPMISGSRPDLAHLAPVIEDRASGLGPLEGICATFEKTSAKRIVFLSVDTPFVPSALIVHLISIAEQKAAPIVLTSFKGRVYPFPSVISRASLGILSAKLESGNLACLRAMQSVADGLGSVLQILPIEDIQGSGAVSHTLGLPSESWLENLNDTQALERARHRRRSAANITIL